MEPQIVPASLSPKGRLLLREGCGGILCLLLGVQAARQESDQGSRELVRITARVD